MLGRTVLWTNLTLWDRSLGQIAMGPQNSAAIKCLPQQIRHFVLELFVRVSNALPRACEIL